MEYRPRILDNYQHQRHFLQLVNIPVFGAPFLYMKNHKAACTTVLAPIPAPARMAAPTRAMAAWRPVVWRPALLRRC